MTHGLLYYVVAAFVGGLILNVMPCVLPVLTMKVFHVIEKAKQDRAVNRLHGLAYGAGIVAMFWALATVVIALRASGERLGWGMQFQSPAFVAVLTALMVAFGLNALGVFEIAFGMGEVSTGQGYLGSFVSGLLAAIMSTPCSAPLLGAAASFALGSGASWWQTALMFTFIGLGLAFPFLLISFVPAVGRRLPRPGRWMETFKQLMGFTLLGAAVWLVGTLQVQLTAAGLQWFLAFLLVLSMALWGMQRFGNFEHGRRRRWLVRLIAAVGVAAAAWWMVDLTPRQTNPSANRASRAHAPVVLHGKINWAPFDPAVVQRELGRGRPVFMDYTADWCANCKTNDKLFVETATTRAALERTQILPMKADYTTENETIEQWMEKLGRSAIPIYVVYYPDGSRDLLPEVITSQLLASAFDRAAHKYPPGEFRSAASLGSAASKPAEVSFSGRR